jgi:hypothetical protein
MSDLHANEYTPQLSRNFIVAIADPGAGCGEEGGKGRRAIAAPLFAWLERNTAALIIVSGVPPTPPRSPGGR